jgi:predicted RNase H-like HicB family nuclease
MASSTVDGDGPNQEIRLVNSEGMWVATDIGTGIASQGESREAALENLDDALALHRGEVGESVESPEAEREILRELDIDPDEIEAAREDADNLPDFME